MIGRNSYRLHGRLSARRRHPTPTVLHKNLRPMHAIRRGRAILNSKGMRMEHLSGRQPILHPRAIGPDFSPWGRPLQPNMVLGRVVKLHDDEAIL